MFHIRTSLSRTARRLYGRLLGTVVIAISLASTTARAQCSQMLAPLFQAQLSVPVYVTVTRHYAQDWVQGWKSQFGADPALYGFGPSLGLSQGLLWWPGGALNLSYQVNSLYGILPVAYNPDKPDDIEHFVNAGRNLTFAVNAMGVLSLTESQKGHAIHPPVVAQGSCHNGLITLIDPTNNSVQWIISFSTGFVRPN